jgi:hypothetical protein
MAIINYNEHAKPVFILTASIRDSLNENYTRIKVPSPTIAV